jgi:shikimate kinase
MSKIRLSHIGNNIVLVGHMGSGKTSIGRNLSKKIDYKFIDTDQEIEDESKMTIVEFFTKNGEKDFRKFEEIITKEILKENKRSVIALGGGSFENDKTRSLILKDNFSIWLKCNLNTLAYRCNNLSTRPLLKNKNIRNEISKLDKIRKKNYMKSNLIVDVSKKTKSLVIREIVNNLNNE